MKVICERNTKIREAMAYEPNLRQLLIREKSHHSNDMLQVSSAIFIIGECGNIFYTFDIQVLANVKKMEEEFVNKCNEDLAKLKETEVQYNLVNL